MWRAMARIQPEMTLDDIGVGTLEDRISRFVAHRMEMYAALARVPRGARRAAQSEPMIGEEFEAGRLVLRRQFLDQFAPELEQLSASDRTRLVTAAEMAFQFESFEYLNRSCADEPEMVSEILVEQLRFYLER